MDGSPLAGRWQGPPVGTSRALPYYPDAWRFQVPPNHVLIGPETASATAEPGSPLVIVSKEQIVGRAWARYYPFWERCLL